MRALTLLLGSSLALSPLTISLGADLAAARQALAESLPEVAAARVERLLRDQPDLAPAEKDQAYLLLAEARLRAGEITPAREALAAVSPAQSPATHYWRGIAFAREEQFTAARNEFALVSVDSPFSSLALFNAAQIGAALDQEEKALPLLETLRATEPDFRPREVAHLEARLHLAAGTPASARAALARLGAAQQSDPTSQLLLGQIELAANHPAAALPAFEKASQGPSHLASLAKLGICDALLAQEKAPEALTRLLDLLTLELSSPLLSVLPSRFETLRHLARDLAPLRSSLQEFVQPATLGTDSNKATPAKLLAAYSLARMSPPDQEQALLARMAPLAPGTAPANQALLRLAEIALAEARPEAAAEALQTLLSTTPASSPHAAQASEWAARLALHQGDPESARTLFAAASAHPNPAFAERALLNQALLTIALSPEQSPTDISLAIDDPDARAALEFARALALAREQRPAARRALRQALTSFPDHPSATQARLALCELLLTENSHELKAATEELALLPPDLPQPLSRQDCRLRHRLGALTGQWEAAVQAGEKHLKRFPKAEKDPHFLLRHAESCFREGELSRAEFLFGKIATLTSGTELAEVALLFQARANLAIPTSEATSEALDILDTLIAKQGPLANEARLRKAHTLLHVLGQAESCLETLGDLPSPPGEHRAATLLAAQAHRELAAGDPVVADRAISLYRQLLHDPATSYPQSNELHYLLAQTFRESGRPEQAIEPCLAVVDGENRQPGETAVEWTYYYRCGFEAIDILLAADRARAALILARKLAATSGPGAEQAEVRAEQIQLEHQLWAD
ncbi:tetratricopeptide repeat protein [Roseibacillus ishigakijimensis]|uniref:Tetratricopeptide repeat protein n=1 Tax=Roseibacillus ishigakijimensis TaxID=454146 RepID=A0A934VM56_9BACT|nr:tetratricopeptide repeat protein [Roseibacillus ishigakijimensis]MBK1833746.1 tetratricopeptide repeat protein [Roseibacillus ishigakijimensis]